MVVKNLTFPNMVMNVFSQITNMMTYSIKLGSNAQFAPGVQICTPGVFLAM